MDYNVGVALIRFDLSPVVSPPYDAVQHATLLDFFGGAFAGGSCACTSNLRSGTDHLGLDLESRL